MVSRTAAWVIENTSFLLVILLGVGVAALVFSHLGLPAHQEQDERHAKLRERVAVIEDHLQIAAPVPPPPPKEADDE